MTALKFGPPAFRIEVEARRPSEAKSADSLTLGTLRISSGEENLTVWTDQETGESFAEIPDIPLIDLANWIVCSWQSLVFDLSIPSVLMASGTSLAQRWVLVELMSGSASRSIYEWASNHALEFAATDYSLPNITFQRRDDFIEVSWYSRSRPAAGSTVVFEPHGGSVLMGVEEFVGLTRSFVEWVASCVSDVTKDVRVLAIGDFLGADPAAQARTTLKTWFPDWADSLISISTTELADLGRDGRSSSPPMMFLRSAVGAITAKDAAGLLAEFRSVTKRGSPASLPHFPMMTTRIDPSTPWESGYRLARFVRHEVIKVTLSERVDIEAQLNAFGVSVRSYELPSTSVEGACFVSRDGQAVAFFNPKGRLSRTVPGRRTTLAHELCHLLFDVNENAMGQLDRRSDESLVAGVRVGSLLEKRANAFAAELLLPREVVLAQSSKGKLSKEAARKLAFTYGVSALVVRHQAENQEIQVLLV